MDRLQIIQAITGLCAVFVANTAWAENSPFVGRWHWNRTQSTLPAGEPAPKDVMAEISRMDRTHVKWGLVVLSGQGQSSVESFDAVADGEFYPVTTDTTAAFRVMGSALQATFKGPIGETDTLTCTLSADRNKMTCKGVLSDREGRTATYVDIYDRM